MELVGCSLPSLLKWPYVSLFFSSSYLSNLFTGGCASRTAEVAKTKDGFLETVEVKGG